MASAYLRLPAGAIAMYKTNTVYSYWHPDWLGTPRVYSSPNRVVNSDVAYAPFGEQYSGASGDSFWTGTAQSSEAPDMKDFPAREYHTTEGRWLSPDPGNAGAVLEFPQTWNAYAYVGNNPLTFVDPSGMNCITLDNGATADDGQGTPCPGSQDPYTINITGDPPSYLWYAFFMNGLAYQLQQILNGYQPTSGGGGRSPTHPNPPPAKPPKNGKNCPAVPQHPPDVSLSANVSDAKQLRWFLPPFKEYMFYLDVRNHGRFDYKQQGRTLDDLGKIGPSLYQDFGNFNFGVVGAAAGSPTQELLRGAGYAQQAAGTSSPEWGHWYSPQPPYGDDPADQAMIRAGIAYYQSGCVQ